MDNHQLIDKIALLTHKISQKNRILREAQEVAKEKDELEVELRKLMWQYLQYEEKTTPTVLFTFNGKNKDLLQKLRQELEKANS